MSPSFNDLPVEVVDVISKFLYNPIDVRNALFVKGLSDSVSRVCKVTRVNYPHPDTTGLERVIIDLTAWNPNSRKCRHNPFENVVGDVKYLRLKMNASVRAYFGSHLMSFFFKSNLPSLVYLDISDMPMSIDINISGFSGASSLKTLVMRNCRMYDLSCIPSFRALTSLDLSYNQVEDDQVIHLANMTRLTSLNLHGNRDVTPDCFEHLPRNLTYLDISGCTIADMNDEAGFKKLPTTITRLVAD